MTREESPGPSAAIADPEQDRETSPCRDCGTAHHPIRLIICADGTWLTPDGAIGAPQGNATNISRLWMMAAVGEVKDATGKTWLQQRHPIVDGIGAVDGPIERLVSGVTGKGRTGYESKIKEIYKRCCKLCPSQDEIFLFGSSRGAFVVRAVAGLLHHLGALRANDPDFDDVFDKSLQLYHAAKTRDDLLRNSVFAHRSHHTRPSPAIKFLGLFDTVKALDDEGLNDMGLLRTTLHARHALALFERRNAYRPTQFPSTDLEDLDGSRSLQEAWFVGTHGNLCGGCEEDGLALWPLQWIVSEAEKYGFKVGFQRLEGSNVTDPSHLIFPRGVPVRQIRYKNGIKSSVTDLTGAMKRPGLNASLDFGIDIPGKDDRLIFKDGGLVGYLSNSPHGVFIHPSVYYLDHKNPGVVQLVNRWKFEKELRDTDRFIIREHRALWNIHDEIHSAMAPDLPRVLIAGHTHAGKSALINKVVGRMATVPEHGARMGRSRIREAITGGNPTLSLHDARGFQTGTNNEMRDVQNFVSECGQKPRLQDQLHCIWADLGRIPLVHVFTMSDKLLSDVETAVFDENRNRLIDEGHQELNEIYRWGDLPDALRQNLRPLVSTRYTQRTESMAAEWRQRFPRIGSTIFVNVTASGTQSIRDLVTASYAKLTSEIVADIHRSAQKRFVQDRHKRAIQAAVREFGRHRPNFQFLGSKDKKSQLLSKAIRAIATVYDYTEPDPLAIDSIIGNALKVPKPVKNDSAILLGIFGGSFLSASIFSAALNDAAIAAGTALPMLWIAGGAHVAVTVAVRTYLVSIEMIIICLEVLLILDRVFWYDSGIIKERYIEGACMHYLRKRPEVQKAVWKEFGFPGTIPTKEAAEKALTTLLERFKYKKQA
ncbi:hypothetical protein AYO20_09574 [Fonsecaea nubica]|uniref:T6SS Phospholipase effector Tle1-like catalytic domain-containing protein n=1 Tax=Fonsecaea nubica TaxID=856822 RepID=A0A178CGG6_9EURO|nr:hypothetical protein AYO20_09574 [Fonsecaea nubica]OAL28155.1 hypothetical protein AYO20_09574 [Fonsecaea nubica]